MVSIVAKIGCAEQALNKWVKKTEVTSGRRVGGSSEVAARLKAPEHENRALRQADGILRKASAQFAQPDRAEIGEAVTSGKLSASLNAKTLLSLHDLPPGLRHQAALVNLR